MVEWDPFRRLPDLSSAQALVELLLNRGVPACLDAPDPLPGFDRSYLVRVPSFSRRLGLAAAVYRTT